ncbi:hypothetical protein F4677DRAFT_441811 [Hypoxylon crocopeplum]|nr:hypothetical protein F4677DRAFT_441811 [Hypoxylon crocopeplum]
MHSLVSKLCLFIGSFILIHSSHAFPDIHNDPTSEAPMNGSDIQVFSSEDMRANILALWPEDHIISSDELDSYILTRIQSSSNEPISLYLNDTGTFVTFDPTTQGNTKLDSRQVTTCNPHSKQEVVFGHAYWAPWQHMTSCVFSNKGSGGYVAYENGVSFTRSIGGSISAATPFEAILGAAFSFEISKTTEITRTYACNFGENDSGQIWGRHRMGWAAVRTQDCTTCCSSFCWTDCGDWKGGWINSPAATDDTTGQQWGCSVGSKANLRCS